MPFMPRNTAAIQAEITRLEDYLASEESLLKSTGADGVNASNADRDKLEKRLDALYQRLDRANGTNPMFARGRVKGLGRGRV